MFVVVLKDTSQIRIGIQFSCEKGTFSLYVDGCN